jgi:methyl coenzyme M reductase beta subunit
MESFSSNSARSLIGRNVNLHLKDGAVIVNVQLTRIHRVAGKNNNQIEYIPQGKSKATCIPLKVIAWAEMLNVNLMQTAA